MCGIGGGMLLIIIKPVETLPVSRHLIELIRRELFSFMIAKAENQGCPRGSKKIMRVL